MAKAPDVATGDLIQASHINSINNSIYTWQDNINANGKGLSGVGSFSVSYTATGTGTQTAQNIYYTASPSSAPGNSFYIGTKVDANYSSSNDLTASWGVGGLYGGWFRAIRSGGSGNVTSAYGTFTTIQNLASGTITNAYGCYVANAYVPSGSITNQYGLYVENINAAGTQNWAIYSAGGKSYHSGNFLIGSNTDTGEKLQVTGIVKFAGTNTTGAGSAALGTNCPATTASAPYTWIQVTTADGSTAYIPAWK